LFTSGKTGEGVRELLEAVVKRVPPPKGDPEAPLRALIFDSTYDPYRGVVSYIRVVDGSLRKRSLIKMMATGAHHEVEEVGVMTPATKPSKELGVGAVGYLLSGINESGDATGGHTGPATSVPA